MPEKERMMFARTDRLLLRPSWPEDAGALLKAVADEAIVRNLGSLPWPYNEDDARAFVTREHSPYYPSFLLFQRTDRAPRLIGACGIHDKNGEAELGYWIARPCWGLGFASEAARAVVAIARAVGHQRLVAGHFIDNPASGRVLRKIGFRATGETVMQQSKGRKRPVPRAMFERSLVSDDNDGGNNQSGARSGDMIIPYDAQLIAA
jgi:RimJ/RimL family protein N-acetyltransferase